MNQEYYIHINGDQEGPLTLSELRGRRANGSIPPDCYCWREGLAGWQPLSDVLPAGPPPVPPALPGSRSVVNAHFEGSLREATKPTPWQKRPLSMGKASFVLGAGSFLILVIVALLPEEPSSKFMALIFIVMGILGTGAAFAVLVAPILGIIALCRKERRKAFPIWGIVLAVLTFLIMGR